MLAVAVTALLAGCGDGGGPRFARADARTLISLAHRISTESACRQARDIPALQRRAIALVNAHRVPADLQEHLMAGVNDLVAMTPPCLPVIPTAPPSPAQTTPTVHDHGKHRGHGDKHGQGEGD